MDQPNKPPPDTRVELHPIIKKVSTLVGYAMLEYADSVQNKAVDKTQLKGDALTFYISQLHTRMLQETENNKYFRRAMTDATRLILQAVSGGKVE